jgi:hypothetical protein
MGDCLQQPDLWLPLWVVEWELQNEVDGGSLQGTLGTGTNFVGGWGVGCRGGG